MKEKAAAEGQRGAKAAVAGMRELSLVHNREQLTHLVEESERLGLIPQ